MVGKQEDLEVLLLLVQALLDYVLVSSQNSHFYGHRALTTRRQLVVIWALFCSDSNFASILSNSLLFTTEVVVSMELHTPIFPVPPTCSHHYSRGSLACELLAIILAPLALID